MSAHSQKPGREGEGQSQELEIRTLRFKCRDDLEAKAGKKITAEWQDHRQKATRVSWREQHTVTRDQRSKNNDV